MTSFALTALLCAVSALELDETPAKAGEWGYRPSQEHAADANPPAFVWRPVKEAASYRLQVAESADFSELAYELEDTPLTSHCPPSIFAEGTYYWRYRAQGNAGEPTPWSEIRTFQVGPGLMHNPKPPLGDLLSRIPEGHPRVFFRPEDVAGLQAKATGDLATQWEQLVARADKLIADPPPTAEPPLYPEGTEYKGEQWKKIWWGNRRYSIAVTDGAATLAFVYRLTGEAKYGEAARDLLLAFAEWDPKGSTNYKYNDEAAMPLLYYPSRAYSWAYDVFTPDERAKIIAVMQVRGADCYDHLRTRKHLWNPYASHSNRAWHFLGEVAIAFNGEIPEAGEWMDYAMTIYYTCYPVWGGADGGWHEGTGYWSSYLGRFMYWVLASQAAFGIDPFDKPFFSKTGYYGMYTVPPGTQSGAWGDQAQNTSSTRLASFIKGMGLAAGNPHWVWYGDVQDAGPVSGYVGFLLSARAGSVRGAPPTDLAGSRVFQNTGLAVLNSNLLDGKKNFQVHFKSSPFGRQSHGYNANNAFLLNIGGERVFIKSGKRDVYGSPHHKEWMWETKSDNAILVNGEGQPAHTPSAQGRITAFEAHDAYDFVEGEAGASYEGLNRWTRRLILVKPDVLVIHDILEAQDPSTFQWLLHAQGKFELGNGSIRYAKTEKTVVQVDFLAPAKLEFSQTDTFDTPPHEWANFDLGEWHFQAGTPAPSKQMEFVTVIKDGLGNVETSLEDTAAARRVRLTNGQYTINIDLADAGVAVEWAR